jgi:hypothetical protein
MMDEGFHQQVLKSTADQEFIGQALANLTRRLMRASINQDQSQTYEAGRALKHVFELVSASEGAKVHEIIDEAVKQLAVPVDSDAWESPSTQQVHIAQNATRFLLEMSCNDSASRGRASTRWQAVESAWELMLEMRKSRRKKITGESVTPNYEL